MQLRHLHYFVKIVEAGSFSRAAATIHVAQPALSQQIADLEARLGATLLHRSARGVRPTVAGEALYREALAILQRMERLPGIVRSSVGKVEGTVRLGMSSTLAAGLAGPLMEACRATLADVALSFVTGDSLHLQSRIVSHGLDIGAVFLDEPATGLLSVKLFRQRLYVIRRREAAAGASVPLATLADTPLVMPARPNVTRALLERALSGLGKAPRIVAETDMLPSMLAAVGAGIADGVVPRGYLSDIPGAAALVTLPIEPALYLTAAIVVSAETPASPAVGAVRSLLVQLVETQLADLLPPGAEWIASPGP